MSGAPLDVSVVLAVRDEEHELARTVASVLAQEEVALELIVVDDGSTDGTPGQLAGLAARDSRVRVVRQEPRGLTAALARGCAEARAPLVARQDAGDVSLPGRFVAQVAAFAAHADVVLVSCWTERVGPQGEELETERGSAPPDEPFAVDERGATAGPRRGPTSHGSAMFRREVAERAGGYRDAFPLAQDWDLWLRLGEHGRALVVGRPLYRRTLSPDSLSFLYAEQQSALGQAALDAARLRAAGLDEAPALERAARLGARLARSRGRAGARAVARGHYHLGQLLRHRGDRRALGYFRAAVTLDPLFARAWVRLAQSTGLAAGRP